MKHHSPLLPVIAAVSLMAAAGSLAALLAADQDAAQTPGEALSLSGLVLLSSTSPMVAPADAFADILPRPFTARRVFDAASPATVFLRVYQVDARTPSAATVRLRVIDEQNVQRLVHDLRLEPAAFEASRSVDFSYDLPLASLSPGEYLITVDVATGGRNLQRTLRFRRR